MEGDIEFGDVQHAQPRSERRPDDDLHYAVAPYGNPEERDLPIFVDLDVLCDMEEHAASDTSVELGGVLLGGQYEDASGRPFVVITDCLRAQHYESTKGSFKFTHETWAEITRQRDAFPEALQMVGWYHTHPDWGVFLSGMDMFICDHFFNKPLDVAYVIDPCRGDRGMFQWTQNARQRVRRTTGFYVMASRFRAAELEQYVDALQQKGPPMPVNLQHGSSSPMVHIHQPSQQGWQSVAVWGTMVAQFCLLAIIAWKLFGDSGQPVAQQTASAATSKHDAALEAEFLDRVVQELRDTPEGFTDRMRAEFLRSQELEQRLETEQRQHQALLNQLDADRSASKSTITSLEASLAKRDHQIESLKNRLAEAQAEVEARDEQLAAAGLGKKSKGDTEGEKSEEATELAGWKSWWVYLTAGVAGVLAIGCVVAAVSMRRKNEFEEELEQSATSGPPADGSDVESRGPRDGRSAGVTRAEIDDADRPVEASRRDHS